ncbi:ATP-binding protein [Cellvibrio sp. UBA7661]|uniref:ATP-binding protein n=1 Tax=Cellvibrio sp. UBA7661 TaxID=1946311 RepID=UPI002F35A2E6
MDYEALLRQLLEKKKLEPYIRYIRFPKYKNFEENTKIDLTFPITALVGANGTNKSSVLRALYGCPNFYSLGELWFSTNIDPIKETGDQRNCFIYGYFNEGADETIEVLKTRIKKDEDPDYWEPSRPVAKYGMKPMPLLPEDKPLPKGRSKTRWDAIDKSVVYIDFRASLSAYDKFFYHSELKGKSNNTKIKKQFIRTRAPHLKYSIQQKKMEFFYRKQQRIVNSENRTLTSEELLEISNILGKKYSEINLIRHYFYNTDAYTCLMKMSDLQYSEAFAGSGEFAVVKLVTDIMSAKESSLILLDEPEVSLHPGAQEKLVNFLKDQVKKNKHQIVISTHSPAIVRQLPFEAVKALRFDSSTQKVRLPNQSSSHDEAFFHIGEPMIGATTIVVEDALAKEVTEFAIKTLGEVTFKTIKVIYFPGGADTLWKYYVPIYSIEKREDVFILFDGDKNREIEIPHIDTISKDAENNLPELIKSISGIDIDFKVDGNSNGGDKEQKKYLERTFIEWIKDHVSYLPGKTPEEFVWDNMHKTIDYLNYPEEDRKITFEKITRKELGKEDYENPTSQEILFIQKSKIATIEKNNSHILLLADKINNFKKLSAKK